MQPETNENKQILITKITSIVVIILAVAVLVLSILGIFNVITPKITNLVTIPLIGVITLINACTQIKKNKAAGIFMFICAAIIFACCIGVYILA